MPADSILHAFTLSPALPRRGGGSTWVAVLQDVMIYEKRFRIPLSKCHSSLVPLLGRCPSQSIDRVRRLRGIERRVEEPRRLERPNPLPLLARLCLASTLL